MAQLTAPLRTLRPCTLRAQYQTLIAIKNITLSADESLIEAARARAASEQTTLNEQFRRWLADYVQARARLQRYDTVMDALRGQMQLGRKLDRDAMNER